MKIPSVEDIKGCHEHKGVWDNKSKLCLEPDDNSRWRNCTMPYKGIRGCWGGEENIYDVNGRILYKFCDQPFFPSSEERVKDFLSTLKKVLDGNDSFAYGFLTYNTVWRCYDHKGKVASCKCSDVVISNSPENAVDTFRGLQKISLLSGEKEYYGWNEEKMKSYQDAYYDFLEESFKERGPYQYHFKTKRPDIIYSGKTGKRIHLERRGGPAKKR